MDALQNIAVVHDVRTNRNFFRRVPDTGVEFHLFAQDFNSLLDEDGRMAATASGKMPSYCVPRCTIADGKRANRAAFRSCINALMKDNSIVTVWHCYFWMVITLNILMIHGDMRRAAYL